MKIEQINIYQVRLKFRKPFAASWGSFEERLPTLIEIISEGISAWGEAAALPYPYYGHEDSQTVYYMLSKYLCPAVMLEQPQNILELKQILSKIKLNNIAKSGLEMAFWDLLAKREQQPLYKMLGGARNQIECGVTLPSNLNVKQTIEQIGYFLNLGYKKIRLKIGRHTKIVDLNCIFYQASAKALALDANGCFSLEDLPFLRQLDGLNALYLEQPLAAEDLLANAKLQDQILTPICLDECIYSLNQAKIAINLKSARAFSLKSARLGGHSELLEVYRECQTNNISIVAGGMFESGIGRAHALAVASLQFFSFPAALAESSYYYETDLINSEFKFTEPGLIRLPEEVGIGVLPDLNYIKKIAVASDIFS